MTRTLSRFAARTISAWGALSNGEDPWSWENDAFLAKLKTGLVVPHEMFGR